MFCEDNNEYQVKKKKTTQDESTKLDQGMLFWGEGDRNKAHHKSLTGQD